MKRTITLRFLLSLCVMTLVSAFCGGNLALAEDSTEDFPTLNDICTQFGFTSNQKLLSSGDNYADKTYTSKSGNINLTFTWGNASSLPETYANQNLRVYTGNTMIISMADSKNKITSIELTFQSATTSRYIDECNTGSLTKNGAVSTWIPEEGKSTSSVTFSASSARTHGRIVGIKVTYKAASVATKQDVKLDMSADATIDLLDSYQATASVVVPDGGAAATGKISYSVEPASGDFNIDAATGLFTAGKTEGTYKIKAIFEGDENYNMAEASTTVTVSSRVWALKNYVQVTDESQVIDGAQYLLVYDDGEDLNVMSSYNSANWEANNAPLTYEGYKDGNLMRVNAEYAGAPFVLEAVGDNYALKTSQGYLQCYVDNYSGDTSYGLMISETSASQAAQWTITIADGKARIVNVYDRTLELCCIVSTWSKYYSSFKARTNNGSYPALTLYAKCADMNFNKLANGYATYAIGSAYQMPAGVKGYVVKGLNDDNEKLVKEEAFSAGGLVPALTPLLVYAENLEGEDKTYYPILLQKEVEDYTGDNYLEYKRTAEKMTASKQSVPVYYYKLTQKVDSENPENSKPLGFYWGAEKGAAFMLNNTSSAYLALPQSLFNKGKLASALLFDEGGQATGIQLTTTTENHTQAVYNLQGVRVSGKLAKGIYIVNGKKVLVK